MRVWSLLSRPDHIPDQTLVARLVLSDHHRGLPDPHRRGQHRLDFAQLDPEPTNLDLVIDTADELHHPISPPPHHITRAVHTLPRHERTRHKPGRGQPRPIR